MIEAVRTSILAQRMFFTSAISNPSHTEAENERRAMRLGVG